VNWYALLADAILGIHFAFVAFVVGGFVVIWAGYFARRAFVHNFRFRLLHLLAMGFVLLEAVVGMVCPLTRWENQLRVRGGASPYQESFMQHWVGRILFYDLSETTFTFLYAAFFLLIILTFVIIPPRRRQSARPSPPR
jgi:uncharacterized protein DUF2784